MIFVGLVKRRETWVLTWRGRLLLLAMIIISLMLMARHIHPFLAVSSPTHGEILVVEGWMPYSTLEQAIAIFNDNDYQLIVTTGGPRDEGYCFPEYATYAELCAATLRQLGVNQSKIVSVPAQSVRSDRTYASALAVKRWLEQSDRPIESVDVFSHGVHARRSQWLFQRAIGDNIEVGIIAAPPEQYDADNWWNWSSGVRSVVDEPAPSSGSVNRAQYLHTMPGTFTPPMVAACQPLRVPYPSELTTAKAAGQPG